MAVFLGYSGRVELIRSTQDDKLIANLNSSDVNSDKDRFSFDFELGTFLTGDQVQISTVDDSLLDFIDSSGWLDSTQYNDGIWYLNVDELGGISLYFTFDDAIAGEAAGRVNLLPLTRNLSLNIKVLNSSERILGLVTSYEFNTERSAVDVTALSEDFKQQYSGLISGSGSISCFFMYKHTTAACASPVSALKSSYELPRYLNELILRTKQGSEFKAKLYLVTRGPKPTGNPDDTDDEVFYEITAVITNIAMVFDPTEPIKAEIDFVTTGKISFKVNLGANYLVQENGGRIGLGVRQGGYLELEG